VDLPPRGATQAGHRCPFGISARRYPRVTRA